MSFSKSGKLIAGIAIFGSLQVNETYTSPQSAAQYSVYQYACCPGRKQKLNISRSVNSVSIAGVCFESCREGGRSCHRGSAARAAFRVSLLFTERLAEPGEPLASLPERSVLALDMARA